MEHLLGLPPDGSAHGPAIDHLIGLVHWLMVVLFVGWSTFFIYVLVRFRKSKHPKASYTGVKSHSSTYLEAAVLIIEVILLAGFSIPLWSKRVDAFPAEKDATVVRVVAEQFAWNVHYPGPDGKFGKTSAALVDGENPLGLDRSDPDAKDDITTINQLNIPVDKPVIVYLSSKDVIHSFNLPVFRVKQDAIPGMSIPVWFQPTKTTDEIRDELRQSFSIAEAMKKVKNIVLPQATAMRISRGMTMENMMSMQDYADSQGNSVLSKGDKLTSDNVGKLADAGIGEVLARPSTSLDKYLSMQDYKDSSGSVVVANGDALTDDAVSKLVSLGVHEVMSRQASNMDGYVVMQAYSDKSGVSIAQKGDALSEDVVSKLGEAGIEEVTIAPATPTEIACAQLCGLGHYRMRGYVTVQTAADYLTWVNQQEEALNPSATQGQAAADSGATPQGLAN